VPTPTQDDIMRERLESKDAELRAMREQVSLLKESVKAVQSQLAAVTANKEECEYQWATTKGQLAKAESDYMMLQVRCWGGVCGLSGVCVECGCWRALHCQPRVVGAWFPLGCPCGFARLFPE
jgi:hypothetical protein